MNDVIKRLSTFDVETASRPQLVFMIVVFAITVFASLYLHNAFILPWLYGPYVNAFVTASTPMIGRFLVMMPVLFFIGLFTAFVYRKSLRSITFTLTLYVFSLCGAGYGIFNVVALMGASKTSVVYQQELGYDTIQSVPSNIVAALTLVEQLDRRDELPDLPFQWRTVSWPSKPPSLGHK